MTAEKENVNKSEKLLQAVRKLAAELEFGMFTIIFKVHQGELTEGEVSEVKRKLKAD